MQQIPFINLFRSAQRVSGDKLAHPQEHFLTVQSKSAPEDGTETCTADLKG